MALPKEPRQKMINIMYLVLTALLALNVSSEILNAFNFEKFRFRLITCEHNFMNREKIYNLLSSKGYRRVFENLSKCDDWYIYEAFSNKTRAG